MNLTVLHIHHQLLVKIILKEISLYLSIYAPLFVITTDATRI